jgi:hypothetical protein
MGYRGKILSFEPDPVSFSKLLQHPGYSWERQQLTRSSKPGKKCFPRASARETVFFPKHARRPTPYAPGPDADCGIESEEKSKKR